MLEDIEDYFSNEVSLKKNAFIYNSYEEPHFGWEVQTLLSSQIAQNQKCCYYEFDNHLGE
jgi:hypothetical protein